MGGGPYADPDDEDDDPRFRDVVQQRGPAAVVSPLEGTRKVVIPQRVGDPRAAGPGRMAPGTGIEEPPEWSGAARPGAVPVPIGSRDMPYDPAATVTHKRTLVDVRECRPGGRGGTPAYAFQHDPWKAVGCVDTAEVFPFHVLIADLQNTQTQIPDRVATSLTAYVNMKPPVRPPRILSTLCARRADGGMLLAWLNHVHQLLDAAVRGGEKVVEV